MMDYLKYFNIGIMLVAPAVVGLVLGRLLDGVFHTYPSLTVAMLFLGILSGLWSMYKSVVDIFKE